MPWKERQKMDQKIEFAMKSVGCSNFGELCRSYGISRKTGYKWRERFVAHGLEGMAEESRRPHSHAQELSESVVCRIVRLKQAHGHWGPKKIRILYDRKHAGPLPSESSFKRILERAGLTQPRKCKRAIEGGRLATGRRAQESNEVWTVDFKGWWYCPEGHRIEPLSVRDEHSRMILELRILASACTQRVRASFEQLFERHGLPGASRSDNGPPFASSHGLLGLSRLSAWWLALGIDLERGRPGCPQDNGAHERMHRDISTELEAGRIGRDQHAFDLWRHEFNSERPHESLAMACPCDIYQPSSKPYTGTPQELDYGDRDTRQVHPQNGTITFQGQRIQISQALAGWNLGLAPRPDGLVEVFFANLLLGHIDPSTSGFQPQRRNPKKKSTCPGADSATLHRPQGRRPAIA
jgi:transposase InsO family protein